MSSRTSSVPHLGPQPGVDKDAIAKHVPPYSVQFAELSHRYETLMTFDTFGLAFMAYARQEVKRGEKKRLLNGKDKIIARQFG